MVHCFSRANRCFTTFLPFQAMTSGCYRLMSFAFAEHPAYSAGSAAVAVCEAVSDADGSAGALMRNHAA